MSSSLGGYKGLPFYRQSEIIYPTSRKTSGVSPWMNAKSFPLRRDFAPDEARGEETLSVSSGELHDFTVEFCSLFIDKRSRTHDQMVQAGRSGKQNIAEGYLQKSMGGKLKLLSCERKFRRTSQRLSGFSETKGV